MNFDPSTATLEEAPSTGFDPATIQDGPEMPVAADFKPSMPPGDTPPPPSPWASIYAGLDGMDERLSPDQKRLFTVLDANAPDPREARAKAINQSYVQNDFDNFPLNAASIDRNWPAIKHAYAKKVLGVETGETLADTAFYGMIQKKLQEPQEQHAKLTAFWNEINKPLVELPEAPKDVPNLPQMGLGNPALSAAIYNGIRPILETAESPFGLATLEGGAALKALSETYPLAKAALASMTGIFTGIMGYQTVKGAPEKLATINNPDASFQDKVTAGTALASEAGLTLLGAVGTALESIPGSRKTVVAKSLEGKTPAEAAEILREEAKRPPEETKVEGKINEQPAQNDFLMTAAYELDKIATPEDRTSVSMAATETPKPTAEPLKSEPVLSAASDKPPVEGAVYSIKNADMDALMQREGLPLATEREAKAWDVARSEAAKKIEADHTAGKRLVEELLKTKRPVTDADGALLLHEEVRLALERKAAESELIKAAEQSDSVAIETAKTRIEGIRKELVDLAEVSKQAGTETGRALAFRKAMLKEDYSLAAMETRRSVANEGRPLTEAQAAEVKALHEKLAAAEQKYTDYRRRASELLMSDEPARKGPPERARSFLSKQAEAARERIKARMREGRVMSGLDPIDLADHAIVGADYIAKGVTKFAEWSGEMLKEFGEAISPHLKDIFARATSEHEAAQLNILLERRKKILEESIAKKQEMLRTGNVGAKKQPLNRPALKDLEEAIQERDALNKEIAAARKGPPVTPEEKALKAYKSRTASRIKELEDRIAKGDFAKKEPTPMHLDKEANQLKAQVESVKLEYDRALERDRYANSSTFQKIKENVINAYDTARLLMTTGEFSFVLRQGKTGVLSHPVLAAKALPNTFRALVADPVAAEALNMEVLNHPDAAAAKAAKLHLVEEGASLNKQEELLMGKLVGKIPVVSKFNQAATVFLNRLRFDMWNEMRKVGMSQAEEKQLALFVNEATGRGGLGSLEAAAVPLGRLMFSPRYFASRIQLATGHAMWGGTWQTRRIIAGEYARTLVGLGLYYTALELGFSAMGSKAEIGTDPRSSDFGKVKLGKSRIDPLAGVAQVAVFAARTASGEKVNGGGKVSGIRGDKVPYGGERWSDVAASFARSKLHPVPGAIVNLFNGTDLGGNKADLTNQALNLSAPVTYIDIYQALEEQDLPEGVSLSLLALLGEGLQTYDANKKSAPEKKFRK